MNGSTTDAPGMYPATSLPVATTTPDPSLPSTSGREGRQSYTPRATIKSLTLIGAYRI